MTKFSNQMRQTIAVALGSVSLLAFQVDDATAQSRRAAAEVAAPAAPSVSDDVDPMVRASIEELQRSGVIDLQSRVGSDLLIIDRLQRRGEAIRTLMETLGTEGLRQMDPQLHASLQDSPIFIAQRIAELELQRALEEAISGPSEVVEEDPVELNARLDGSEIFAPVMEDPYQEEPEVLILDLPPIEMAQPSFTDFPISLREIFGSNGVFQAIILHGSEPVRVTAGDLLPNDTEILEILEDRIKVRRRDREFDIHLRG